MLCVVVIVSHYLLRLIIRIIRKYLLRSSNLWYNMVAGGIKRSNDGVNVENRQARRRRLKREAAANESQTWARPCRRILGAPLMIMLRWEEHRMNQAHWIAIRGGLVLDSGMKPRP